MTNTSARSVVTALVSAGMLDAGRAEDAEPVVQAALHPEAASGTPMRRRMAEVAGYVGGAFVLGAAALFLSSAWADLRLGVQVGVLLGSAAILAVAGIALAGWARSGDAGGRAVLTAPAEAVRLRLTSVLLTGAAACAGFGVGLLLTDTMANEELGVMLAALLTAVLALLGYVVAPTTVGQAAIAVAAFVAIPTGLSSLHTDDTGTIALGLIVLALGVAWLAAAETGLWQELLSARLIGCFLAVLGAQLPVFDQSPWVGYVATAVVGAAAFWRYVGSRAWPYLATGVIAVTLAVPEALDDWVGGSLGAAGILLATGVTLLVAALVGLRLRHEVTQA